jgi:PAS domain S-box-containing protein
LKLNFELWNKSSIFVHKMVQGIEKILILDDKPEDIKLIHAELRSGFSLHNTKVAQNKEEFEKLYFEFSPEVILSDFSLPGYNGLQAFEFCMANQYEGVFILLAENIKEESLVEFLKEGMDDYLQKPHLKRLNDAIKNSLERVQLHRFKEKALKREREQEQLLKDLFESCFEATILTKNGVLVDVNPTFEQLFQYTKEDLLGKAVFNYIHPDFIAEAKYHILNNTREKYLLKIYAKNGQLLTTEVLGRPIVINGETLRLTSLRDITKIEQQEESLTGSLEDLERKQKILLDLARDSHSNVENSIRKILKVDAEMLQVERVSLWVYSNDRSKIQCRLMYKKASASFEMGALLSSETNPIYFEYIGQHRYISADDAMNDPRTVEFSETYLKVNGISSMLDVPIWVHGNHVGILCHEHVGPQRHWLPEEITMAANLADFLANALGAEEQEKTLKRLIKSEFRSVEHKSSPGIGEWELDVASQTLFCSPETYLMHGRDPKTGTISLFEYSRLVHPDDRNLFNDSIHKVLKENEFSRFGYRIILPNGKTRYIQAKIKRLDYANSFKVYGTIVENKLVGNLIV